MKGPSKEVLRAVGKLRNWNPAQIYHWALVVYKAGFEEGLREGEAEYDDALVLTEDEAWDRLGQEAFEKLMGGM